MRETLWRNQLAGLAVDRKPGGLEQPRDAFPFWCVIGNPKEWILIKKSCIMTHESFKVIFKIILFCIKTLKVSEINSIT